MIIILLIIILGNQELPQVFETYFGLVGGEKSDEFWKWLPRNLLAGSANSCDYLIIHLLLCYETEATTSSFNLPNKVRFVLPSFFLFLWNSFPSKKQIPGKPTALINDVRCMVSKVVRINYFYYRTNDVGTILRNTCQQRLEPAFCGLTMGVQEGQNISPRNLGSAQPCSHQSFSSWHSKDFHLFELSHLLF